MLTSWFLVSGNKIALLLNLVIHILYSSYFLYGLEYKSEGGVGLVWWFYLLLFLWTHAVIHFIQVTYQLLKARKKQ